MAKKKNNQANDTRNAQLHATLGRTRWQIAIVAVLVLLFTAVLVGYLTSSGSLVQVNEKKLLAKAQERVTEHLDEITTEVAALGAEVTPHVYDEIAEQAKKDYPKYLYLSKEQTKKLRKNIEVALRKKLRTHFREFLRENRQLLAKKFPKYATDQGIERLIEKFEKAYDRLLSRYYINRFGETADRTEELWAKFPPLSESYSAAELDEKFAEAVEGWILANIEQFTTETKAKK